MSTNMIWFGSFNFKIVLIPPCWSQPFTTTRIPVVHLSAVLFLLPPFYKNASLQQSFFLYTGTLFQCPSFKVTAARGNTPVWILRLLWKCWNKEFDWKPSNNSAYWELIFLSPHRLWVLISGLFSKWHDIRVVSTQKWLFSATEFGDF